MKAGTEDSRQDATGLGLPDWQERANALENAKDAIGMSTPEGRHYYQNRAFTELFGEVGESPSGTVYCDQTVGEEVFRTLMAGREWLGEVQMYGRDGRVLDIELKAYPNKDAQGRVTSLVGIHTDITARKKMAENHRRSDEKYRHLYESMREGVAAVSLEGQLMEFNDSFQAMAGYSREELYRMTLFDLTPPRWHEMERNILEQQVLVRGYSDFFEKEYVRKDGSLLPIELTAFLEQDEQGRPTGFWAIIRDISERKRAEAELRHSAEFRKRVFESSHTPIIVMDAQTYRYLDCNPSAVEVYGYKSREEVIGMSPKDLSAPLQYDGTPSDEKALYYIRRAKTEGAVVFEWKHRRPDGTEWDAEVHLLAFQVDQGELMQFSLVDITSRKRAEEEKLKLQAQLAQSQKMESIGRLAGGIAHDFNNMLSAIFGNTELALAQTSPSDPLRAYLQEISKAAERSANLTRQLLAFARKQTVSLKCFDLNEAVDHLRNMLQRLIGEAVELVWKPSPGPAFIEIDPSQMDQLLVNLCINAKDAIRDVGEIVIETQLVTFDQTTVPGYLEARPGDYVRLSVRDNGCGMDPAVMSHLFEPFFTTKSLGSGTGLGLATVYGIVQQNNGFIQVESEAGRGTTFRVYLPNKAEECGSLTVKNDVPVGSGRSETILLVEDEPVLLKMTRNMLAHNGYLVLPAGGPREALALAREHGERIRLVLTDVIMPEMNGRELVSQIQAFCPHVRCLYMSGYTANVIEQHGVLDAEVHFIQKPFSLSAFLEKVKAALQP